MTDPESRWGFVTHSELDRRLRELWDYVLGQAKLINKLGEQAVVAQSDIDALTAEVTQEDSDLNSAVTAIQAEIVALQQANPALDLSGLQSEVDAVKTAVAAAAALVPAPPTPPAGG